MPRTPQSKGTYSGCKAALGRMAMHRHLGQCEKIVGGGSSRVGATVGRLRIAIDTPDGSPYWIIVDAHPNATLKGLDDFLRELWLECRAFGIGSPKEGGMDGSDVGRFFAEKRFLDIARYNARDLRATKQLYDVWREYVQA